MSSGEVTVTVIGGLVVMCTGAVLILFALARMDDERHRQHPTPPPAPVITDPFKAAVLEHACGPCNNVAAARTCICAGYCGHRHCRGRAGATALSGALQRLTREGGGRG